MKHSSFLKKVLAVLFTSSFLLASPTNVTTTPETTTEFEQPTIEIELKFEILDPAALNVFLAPLKKLHAKRNVDVYYDTIDGTLIKRGIWIRTRDDKTLDIKFNQACLDDPSLPMQPYCEEHTFKLPLMTEELKRFNEVQKRLGFVKLTEPALEKHLESNGFIIHRVVDKIRTTYALDEFTLVVDEVASLGTFIEIELMTTTAKNISEIIRRMEKHLENLPRKSVKTSYDSLILRKQNFDQYLQSRFVLEEDKNNPAN